MMTQGFKRGSRCWTKSPTYLFLQLIQHIQEVARSTSLDMTMVFHVRPYCRFTLIKSNLGRKKLHRTNQGYNFLGGSFSNTDNVRVPTQFRRERRFQHLKIWFFLKNRPIHFHINSVRVMRLFKLNKLTFPSIEINKPNLTSVCSVFYVRFKFKN